MHCHNCNNPRPAHAAFCPTCGAGTTAVPPSAAPVQMSKGSDSSIAPIAMSAVVVVALVLGGVAFLTSRSPSDSTDAVSVTDPTTVTTVAAATTAPPTTAPPTTATLTTTTTAATTTTTTTTTVPPDPRVVAQGELIAITDQDRPRLSALAGTWLPQVSAKQEGTVWPGVYFGTSADYTYFLPDIVVEYKLLEGRYGVVMANGAEFNFRFSGRSGSEVMTDWYITLVDQPFTTSGGALEWCRQNLIDRENCAAKFITNDQDIGRTLELQ